MLCRKSSSLEAILPLIVQFEIAETQMRWQQVPAHLYIRALHTLQLKSAAAI